MRQAAIDWWSWGLKCLYSALLIFIAAFLHRLGAEPWAIALHNWPIFIAVVITTSAGIVVQAQAFRAVLPVPVPVVRLKNVVRVWALAAISSLVAPFFSGLATRTVLLVRAGMSLDDCLTASTRQFWLGIEFSALLAAMSLPFTRVPDAHLISFALLFAWLVLVLLRRIGARRLRRKADNAGRMGRLFDALRSQVNPKAYVWFVLQILLMSASYYVCFNGLGASLSVQEAVALSAFTVLMSILILVPNGLGIIDGVWIYIATQSGVILEASVAIAIIFRMGHLFSSCMLIACTWIQNRRAEAAAFHFERRKKQSSVEVIRPDDDSLPRW